jgi:lipopolysaccharide export system permease protein
MQFLWRYIDDLVGKGLEFKVIAELLLYTSSSLVPMALPLSILMSSLMTFGNMGEFYELTAMKASGISLQRILMPLVVFVVFISIGAFFFANEVLPFTNLKMRSLLYDVRNQRPEIQIIPGSFYSGIDGYSLRVERKDPSTNMLYDIKIYDHTQNKGNGSVTIADSGKMIITEDERDLIFTLYSGSSYNEASEERGSKITRSFPHRFDRFEEERIIIRLVGFNLTRTDEDLFRNHYSMLDLAQLETMEDSIKNDIQDKKEIIHRTLIVGNYFRKHTKPARTELLNGDQKFAVNPDTINRLKVERKRIVKPDAGQKTIIKIDNRDSIQKLLERRKLKRPLLSENTQEKPAAKTEIKPAIPADNRVLNESNKDTGFYLGLYDRLTLKEKENVLNAALSYSRSARTFVVSSAQTIDSKTKNLRRFEIEWQRKFTIAFACLIFLFIGAPLGAIIRKGGLGLPLVISTLFFIFYYIISLVGEKMVREGFLLDYQGMWFSSFIFFVTGVFLTYKATTDSAMLNFDTYAIAIRNFLGIRRGNILDDLKKKDSEIDKRMMKYDNLISSLTSFRDTIAETIDYADTRLKFEGFLVSLAGFRESSNIILFERLYKNIIYYITNSEFIKDKSVRNKLSEFPNFTYKSYYDLKWRLYLRLILLLIPPFTLIILGRHYIQLILLKSKLRAIDQLTEDLIMQLKKNEALAK